jgi:hypothetical protein
MTSDCKTILTVALAIPFLAYVAVAVCVGATWPLWAWLLWG